MYTIKRELHNSHADFAVFADDGALMGRFFSNAECHDWIRLREFHIARGTLNRLDRYGNAVGTLPTESAYSGYTGP